jgi:DNA-binding MarR family transcriptional regulator
MSLEPDEQDRRATRARLTPDGAGLRAAVLAYRRRELEAIARAVDPPASADALLGELAERFEAHGR